jgi:hypothetical protein
LIGDTLISLPPSGDLQNQVSWRTSSEVGTSWIFSYRFCLFLIILCSEVWGINCWNSYIAITFWWPVKPSFLKDFLRSGELHAFSLMDFIYFGICYVQKYDESIGDIFTSLSPSGDLQNQVSWRTSSEVRTSWIFSYGNFLFYLLLWFHDWGIDWWDFQITTIFWWPIKPSFVKDFFRSRELHRFSLMDFICFCIFYDQKYEELIGETFRSLPISGDLENQVSWGTISKKGTFEEAP